MRAYMRAKTVDGVIDDSDRRARRPVPAQTSRRCTRSMAIANYEDRFVIPTAHRETRRGRLRPARLLRLLLRQRLLRRQDRDQPVRLADARPRPRWRSRDDRTFKALSALLTYPTEALQAATGEIAAVLGREGCCRRAARAPSIALLAEIADRRHLRPAGALRPAVRPQPHAVAASVRACARRKPRPRPGHGRPARRCTRTHGLAIDRRRTAGLPAAVPGVPVAAAARGGARTARPDRRTSCARWPSGLRQRESAYAAVFRCAGRARGGKRRRRDDRRRAAEGPIPIRRSRRARCRLGGGSGPVRPRAQAQDACGTTA